MLLEISRGASFLQNGLRVRALTQRQVAARRSRWGNSGRRLPRAAQLRWMPGIRVCRRRSPARWSEQHTLAARSCSSLCKRKRSADDVPHGSRLRSRCRLTVRRRLHRARRRRRRPRSCEVEFQRCEIDQAIARPVASGALVMSVMVVTRDVSGDDRKAARPRCLTESSSQRLGFRSPNRPCSQGSAAALTCSMNRARLGGEFRPRRVGRSRRRSAPLPTR